MTEENNEKPNPQIQKIEVTVDNEQMKAMALELAEEKLKNQKHLTNEEKLGEAEVQRINNEKFIEAKLDFAERTGDDSFRECKSKEELTKKLNEYVKLGVEQAKIKGKEPSGNAPLNSQQYGQQGITDLRKLPVNANTILYLNNLRRNGDKNASQILDELWAKSISSWRQSGHQPLNYSPDDAIQKSNETPELNFDNYSANEENSHLAQFGIKKTPFGYSKSHTQGGQKKTEGS
jgi:transcriptional regulator of met regulon